MAFKSCCPVESPAAPFKNTDAPPLPTSIPTPKPIKETSLGAGLVLSLFFFSLNALGNFNLQPEPRTSAGAPIRK